MRVIHRLMITLTFAGTLLVSRAIAARAQSDPPDLKMLLNLDLYGGSQAKGSSAAGAPGEQAPSMLDQIRTLRAMGYLKGEKQKSAAAADAGGTQAGQPAGNVEVMPRQSDQGAPQL